MRLRVCTGHVAKRGFYAIFINYLCYFCEPNYYVLLAELKTIDLRLISSPHI
jgi:hypothetical protein